MEQIAQRFFHPAEADAVLATARRRANDAFLRCWTAKEAVLKAYGTGIAASLDAFQVPLAESYEGWVDLSALPSSNRDSRCWLQRLSPCNDYVAAAAFMGSERLRALLCVFSLSGAHARASKSASKSRWFIAQLADPQS